MGHCLAGPCSRYSFIRPSSLALRRGSLRSCRRRAKAGRFGKLRHPAVMHDFATKILWIYILLLLVGGLMGFFKAKSKVSLVTSTVFAAILILTTVPGILDARFARNLADIIML